MYLASFLQRNPSFLQTHLFSTHINTVHVCMCRKHFTQIFIHVGIKNSLMVLHAGKHIYIYITLYFSISFYELQYFQS